MKFVWKWIFYFFFFASLTDNGSQKNCADNDETRYIHGLNVELLLNMLSFLRTVVSDRLMCGASALCFSVFVVVSLRGSRLQRLLTIRINVGLSLAMCCFSEYTLRNLVGLLSDSDMGSDN